MNETFKQLKGVWDGMGRPQKILVGVVSGLVFLSLIIAVVIGGSTQYLPLAAEIESAEAQKILARLDEAEIDYRVSSDGGTIRVDAERLREARALLLKEGVIPGSGSETGYAGLTDMGISMTDDQRAQWMRVLQEQELAKTIRSYNASVRRAKVHITPMIRRSFKRGDQPAKAVVNIQNEPGRFLDASQVQAIQVMVANAVQALEPKRVAVIDSSGRNLAVDTTLAGKADLFSVAKRAREEDLQVKLASALAAVVGPDDVKVRVTLSLDRERIESTNKDIDKGSKAVTRERVESPNNSRQRPQGQPSTANAIGGGRSGDSKMEKVESDYDYSTKVTRRIKEAGAVQRMSVAVFVNSDPSDPELDRSALKAQLEETARAAVGIDLKRGDTFALHLLPFHPPAPEAPLPETGFLDDPRLLQWSQWGLAALLSLVVMIWLLRSAKKARVSLREALREEPEEEAEGSADGESEEEQVPPDPAEEIIEVARSNPEAVGRLLRNWMYEAAK